MPPKAPTITRVGKRPPAPPPSAGSINKDVLKASYLKSAAPTDLLDRLLEILAALDGLSNAELATGTPVVSQLPKDFVGELLKGEYLTSPSNDVRTVVALCLACMLGGGAAASLVRGFGAPVSADLFSDSKCLDALKLVAGTICILRTAAGQQTRSYIRRLIEKCASRHVFHSLLQRLAVEGSSPQRASAHDQTARAAEVDGAIEALFQAVLHGIEGDDNSMVAQLALLLNDVVEVHRTLTATQLNLLITAVVPRTTSTTPSTGVRVATSVLRRQADVLATSVCQEAVYSGVEAALEEIHQAELGEQDAAGQADRRNAMRKLGTSLETCIALSKVSTQLVSQMIGLLQQHLDSPNNDVRLVFARTFSRIFTAVSEMASEFPPTYHTFLSLFSDSRPPIRVELVKYAKEAILANPHTDPAWITLSPLLSNKLVDSDESVRRAAVNAVVDIALVVPKRVPNRLYEELAHRCKDKHQRVRQTAVERLASLYAATKLGWIPNAIFTSALIAHGADISLVETALVAMLPAPSTTSAEAAGVSAGQLANRKKQAKLGFTKKESFKFDFEGDGPTDSGLTDGTKSQANRNSIVSAFATLCGHLNGESWQMLLSLMRKKAQLRLTVRRLFEVRAAIKAKVNVEGNTDAARRLISFLTSMCHCDNEWSALFVEKDDSLGRQLAAVCEPTCKDFFTAGEVQLLSKAKARTKGDMYAFLNDNVCKRLYLPLSESDAIELVSAIDTQRSNVARLAKMLASSSSSSSSPAEQKDDIKKRHDREINAVHGSMRALMAIGAFAPQLLYPTAVVALCRWVREDAAAASEAPSSHETTKKSDMSKAIAMSLTILEGVVSSHRDATREQHHTAKKRANPVEAELEDDDGDEFDVPLPDEVMASRKEIITAIGQLCVRTPSADIAKAAARCLTSMFQTSQPALKKLSETIKQKLTMVVIQMGSDANQTAAAFPPQLVPWIKTLTVLFTSAPSIASHAFSDVVVDALQQLLQLASTAHTDVDDLDIRSRAVAQRVLRAEDGPEHSHTRDATATVALLTFCCPNAEVVDACAKALVKYALISAERARSNAAPALPADFVPTLYGGLITVLRNASSLPSGSIGAAQKKLAIHKQIMKLVVKAGNALTTVDPSFGGDSPRKGGGKKGSRPDGGKALTQGQREILGKEISAMMFLSGEDQDIVRREAAKALKRYVVSTINKVSVLSGTPGADARHVAMLIMTAVLEGSRGGYTELRGLLQEIHEKMVMVRATVNAAITASGGDQQGVHLGDPRAPRLFLEYAVPPLVLYMAHHPFYSEEKSGSTASEEGADNEPSTPFKTFMRAWHLLFEELFAHDTQPAAAVHEMFRKLRQLDDAIAKPGFEDATRVICDLGAKTMLAVLSEKNTTSTTNTQYPGSLLIPTYFCLPTDPSQFPSDKVYLPRACVVSSHPVFGAPVGTISASVAPNTSRTPARLGGVSQSRARSTSTAPPTATKYRPATTTTAVAEEEEVSVTAPQRTPLGSPVPKVATGGKRDRDEGVDLLADPPGTERGVRKRLEMDEAATRQTPAKEAGRAAEGRRSIALPKSDDDSLTLDTRRAIMGVVHGQTSGKTQAELEGVTFKVIKEGVCAALKKKACTEAEKQYIKVCLQAAVEVLRQSQ